MQKLIYPLNCINEFFGQVTGLVSFIPWFYVRIPLLPMCPTLINCYFLMRERGDFFFSVFFVFSRAAPEAYGGSLARGPIGAVAASLGHSHSNWGSEPRLQPTPQLTATLDR